MSEGPVQGDPTDLAQMVQQVERRNSVLVRLAGGVEGLSREVAALRRDIDDRPTKEDVAQRRRRSLAVVVLLGASLIWGHDAHIEACSPGSQANSILEYATQRALREPPPKKPMSPTQIRALVERTQPTDVCDLTFPLHAHGANGDGNHAGTYPGGLTGWNVLGIAFYTFVGGILYLWQRGPRRRSH